MGRHGGNGDDASPDRGKRRPESAPEPGYGDEPIGRRLRPEESAVTETRTGFLGSGWTSESEPSGSSGSSDPWPQDEERSGGRIKMTLLAVAAVVVVLGGTVAGVRALAGSGEPADCPPAGCAAAVSNQPAPQTDLTAPAEEPAGDTAPAEEPDEAGDEASDETAEPTPTTAPTSTRRGGGVTSSPRPTATRKPTRTPRATDAPPPAADEPEDPDETTSQSPVVGDRTQAPAQSTATAEPDPVPSPTDTFGAPMSAGGAAITVGVDVVRNRAKAHTVKLVVAADESVQDLRVSVPVSGEVISVNGADWEQVGDDLVIESPEGLEAGEELVVTFTASGQAKAPATCRSDQGECAVS